MPPPQEWTVRICSHSAALVNGNSALPWLLWIGREESWRICSNFVRFRPMRRAPQLSLLQAGPPGHKHVKAQ